MSKQQENTCIIPERILRLKPSNRSKATEVATAYIPTLESGGFSSFSDKK